MGRIKGKHLELKLDNSLVGLSTSCNVTTNSVFIDSRTKDDDHPENELDYVEVTITSESIMGDDIYLILVTSQQTGTELTASVTPASNSGAELMQLLSASVKVESVALNAPAEGYATVSATLKGYLVSIR